MGTLNLQGTYSLFDAFFVQNTLAQQGRFSTKMHFKADEKARRPKFAPINL